MIIALTISLFPCSGIEQVEDKSAEPKTETRVTEKPLKKNNVKDTSYFKAEGNDSSWSISIDNKNIIYRTAKPDVAIKFPFVEPVQVGETKVYKTQNKKDEIEIVIYDDISFGLSQVNGYDHSIAVYLKRNIHSNTPVESYFSGDGYYIFNCSLSGSWVLQSFEEKPIEYLNINQIPLINIDVNGRNFSGNGDKHLIYGDLSCEGIGIGFKNIIYPKGIVDDSIKEKELLYMLKDINKFKLVEDELFLFIEDELKMIFRRDAYYNS